MIEKIIIKILKCIFSQAPILDRTCVGACNIPALILPFFLCWRKKNFFLTKIILITNPIV
ncbi:hypothetical protein HZS_756 [Henneguya salminicola]|nr:hypothetical protein HZS_756 [Henneguya salminicola]